MSKKKKRKKRGRGNKNRVHENKYQKHSKADLVRAETEKTTTLTIMPVSSFRRHTDW